MRIGLVCPYSFDVPGGVQNHVRDLAESLHARGCAVSVLAPRSEDGSLPGYVVPAGRAVPVPYNGSVARLTFGPRSMARARHWLRDGDFDVLHVHEPTTPSLSLLALWAAEGPVVATFHTATVRSRAMAASAGILRPALGKISARIAVSEPARATLAAHIGGSSIVVPNGVFVQRFRCAERDQRFAGGAGTVVFLGRFDEPRKGLPVLLEAFASIADARPGVRLLVAGYGDIHAARELVAERHRDAVTWLGLVDDAVRARLLATADVFVAPNTGGESFGLVLLEAMAAGAPVVASDLEAFGYVCEAGRYGALFRTGDSADLAQVVLTTLGNDAARQRARAAGRAVWRYDWSGLTTQIMRVYETVVADFAA